MSRVELTHGNGSYALYALFRLSHRSLIVYLYCNRKGNSFFIKNNDQILLQPQGVTMTLVGLILRPAPTHAAMPLHP